jgi:hypothetical protein
LSVAHSTSNSSGAWLGRLRSVAAHPLAAILVFAFLQSVAWSIVIPPFQAPDEDAHFAYTQQLVERHRVPSTGAPGSPYSTEFTVATTWGNFEPTRGAPEARTGWSPAEESAWQGSEKTLKASQRADGTGGNPAAQNPPLYYVYESVPYWLGLHTSDASFFTRLELMRLANIPLYLATICFVWLLALEVLGRRWCAAVAASVVVLQPKFGFISSGVSPDVALAAAWSAFVYVGVRIVTTGVTRLRVVALAACGIAALLTQPRSAAVVPIALLVLALAPRARLRAVAVATTVVAFAAATLAYVAFAQTLPGWVKSPSSLHPWQFLSYLWQFYLPRLPGMAPMVGPDYGAATAWVNRFFGDFGWLEIPFPNSVNTALRGGTVLLLVLLAVGLVIRRHAIRRHWRVAAVLVAAVVLELLVLHVAAFESLLSNPGDPILTGRYLFPLISIWGLAVAAAASILPRVLRAPGAAAVLGAAAMLDVLAFIVVIERFYE